MFGLFKAASFTDPVLAAWRAFMPNQGGFMKVRAVIIGALAAVIAGHVFAQEDAIPDDENDAMAYVTSFTAPFMTELCAPVMPSYAAELEAVLQPWQVRNTDSIERGKQQEISHLWPGKTIEEFEQLTKDATRDAFNAVAKDRQLKRCTGMLMFMAGEPE